MYRKIVEFRPSISSENLGDHIIQCYVDNEMRNIFGEHMTVTMPTRSRLTKRNYVHIESADFSFVCGTNLLASNMKKRRQWDLSWMDAYKMREVVLLGVGWWQYQDDPDAYTKWMLKHILSSTILHSVRDSYTEKKLRSIGITNIVNTACPTMWNLTSEKCSRIPESKAACVVTTLTNYMTDDDMDQWMLNLLSQNYETVYIWLQAIEDEVQLGHMKLPVNCIILPPTLGAYENILNKDIDYVGTRLHAGIHALNFEKRSIILAVDNRALEIAKDTDLPVIKRSEAKEKLECMINSEFETKINVPFENVEKWCCQFTVGGGTN